MPVRMYNTAAPSTPAPIIHAVRSQAATNVAFHLAVINVSSAFSVAGFGEADELKEHFMELADEWHDATEHLSAPPDIAMHHAYQTIIGMGDKAVPLILDDLRKRGGHWYWALRAITEASPAPANVTGNMRAIRDAWMNWGKLHGYLVN